MTLTQAVDPALVPKRRLYTGAEMPAIGIGTFGSDYIPAHEIAQAVKGAVSAGYRHIDCAAVYGNEDAIGAALQELFRSGLRREELWIVSKLWNDQHAEEDVAPPAANRSLIFNWIIWTCISSTGRFRTTTRLA